MDWRPGASMALLKQRAELLRETREFFHRLGVWEVETPALASTTTPDPMIESFQVPTQRGMPARDKPLYLHTSPEFFMKRLLAAGSGSVYQMCKVFREGETGRLHNPEFTLLEWYRVGFDHHQLMDELDSLLRMILADCIGLADSVRITYQQAFQQYSGIDPYAVTISEMQHHCAQQGIELYGGETMTRDDWLNLILTHQVEPQLGKGRLTYLYDYPASQASLARVRPGPPAVAERFEVYFEGVELANGFHELLDADEQRGRFEADLGVRRENGQPQPPLDEPLLAALTQGLPSCAGVAVGMDRLVMLACNSDSLEQSMAFSINRA